MAGSAPERLGLDRSGRTFFSLVLPSLADWPRVLTLASPYFVGLIVLDEPPGKNDEATPWARRALEQGLVYACVWGRGCEHVHDVIDEEFVALTGREDRPVVMTTWHDGRTLEEAVNIFMVTALPADGYEPDCSSWLLVEAGATGQRSGARDLISDRLGG